jgi:hypothetical protein
LERRGKGGRRLRSKDREYREKGDGRDEA